MIDLKLPKGRGRPKGALNKPKSTTRDPSSFEILEKKRKKEDQKKKKKAKLEEEEGQTRGRRTEEEEDQSGRRGSKEEILTHPSCQNSQ